MKFKPSAQELAVVVEVFERAKADGCPYGGDGECRRLSRCAGGLPSTVDTLGGAPKTAYSIWSTG